MQGKGYSSSWLEELKNKCDIISVVSKYIRLEQKGRKYWGCCPFHHEKTPSFCVDLEGFYYCFGCKESGDVISFVQHMESCDFIDAIKILAESVNMEIPELSNVDEKTIERKKEKDIILKILDETFKYYEKNLYLTTAKKAQNYIRSRNFTKKELDDFRIGYSNNWSDLVVHLKKCGFSYEDMLKAGVVNKKDGTNNYYDVMAERLIFPIFNSFNECVGFSARVLEKSDYAKYKNTAETMVFQKNKLVYGIHLLKKLKNQGGLKKIILVEGQIDVIAMHRAGFNETVACMGTALTENHAKVLKKYCDDIVICFDGDTAGEKATLKAIEILRKEGLNLKIVKLKKGDDPDEVLKREGKEGLQNYINNTISFMDFLILLEKEKFNLEKAEEKGRFVSNVLKHLRTLKSSSAQEPYLDKIRDLTKIPVEILRKDLNNENTVQKNQIKPEENVQVIRENANVKAEKFLLASLLHKKDFVDKKINYYKLLPNRKEILDIVLNTKSISTLFDQFDMNSKPFLADLINFNFELYNQIETKYFNECLKIIAKELLTNQQIQLSKQASLCEDFNQKRELFVKLNNIMKKIKNENLEEFYD